MLLFQVTRSGVFICLDDLTDDQRQKARTLFTLKHETLPGIYDSRTCYKFDMKNRWLLIPRFATQTFLRKIKKLDMAYSFDVQINMNDCKFDFECKLDLTNNQQLVLDYLKDNYLKKRFVKDNTSGIIIKMAAGQGKTYLSAGIINHVGRRCIYVCDSSGLLHQTYDVLVAIFGSNYVGKLYGKEKIYGDIMVCTIHSILSDAKNIKLLIRTENAKRGDPKQYKTFATVADFYEHYDLIIFDECQRYTSPEAYKIFKICQRPYMIGMSATPEDEIKGFHKILEWNIGPILDVTTLPGFSMDETNFTGIVRVMKYSGPEGYIERELNENTGMIAHDKIIAKICSDPYRMELVLDIIRYLCKKERKIVVFAQTLEYLNELERQLPDLDVLNIEKIHQLRGTTDKHAFEDAKNTSKLVLTTYQYFGVGKSFPHMDSAVFATPRKTGHVQFVNRIFRRGGDETITRIIYDVVDWCTTLKSQYYKRLEKYKLISSTQHKLTFKEKLVSYKDYSDE
jgi:superfamily II DNA or RNA helicase